MSGLDDMTPDEYQAEVRRLRAELLAVRQGEGLRLAPEPKPLRQADIIRELLAERKARAAGGEHSSVELWANAKHEVQIRVTVRTGDSDDDATVEQAAAKAAAVYDTLRALYPVLAIEKPAETVRPSPGPESDA